MIEIILLFFFFESIGILNVRIYYMCFFLIIGI